MPRNGSGTFNLVTGNPVVTGTTISSTVHNNTMTDIATGLTNSIAKDGQTTPTGDIPFGGNRIKNVGAATAVGDGAQVEQVQNSTYINVNSVSGTNTITGTLSPVPSGYTSGQFFILKPANNNTGATTANFSSLGEKDVQWNGAALAGGEIKANIPTLLRYNGTAFDLFTNANQLVDGPRPIEVHPYTLNTTTGNQDITLDSSIGKDKTPIAAMFVQSVSDGLSDTQARLSIGFFDGTTSVVIATDSENGVATTNTVTRGATDECVMQINQAGTVLDEASGVSLIENGVRINVGVASGSAIVGACYLFFDDDGDAKVDTFTSNATENNSVTVTPNISTDIILSLSPASADNFFDDAAHDGAQQSLGFAINNGNQVSAHWSDVDNSGTSLIFEAVNSTLGALAGTPDIGLEYDNFTATQFDATTRGAAGGGTYGYLALSMPNAQFHTSIIDTPTSTGRRDYTAPGFRADSLLQIGTIIETADSTISDRTAEGFRVGGATKAQIQSAGIASEDGVGTSDTESRYDEQIRGVGADTHHDTSADTFTSLGNGFRLNFTSAHTTAKKWPILAIGRA